MGVSSCRAGIVTPAPLTLGRSATGLPTQTGLPPPLAMQLIKAIFVASEVATLGVLIVPGCTSPGTPMEVALDGLRILRVPLGSPKRKLPMPPARLMVKNVGKTLRDWLTTAPRI